MFFRIISYLTKIFSSNCATPFREWLFVVEIRTYVWYNFHIILIRLYLL
nr:MAG TPA: hypothetical protein [Caudoviricetes sp.]